MLGLGRAIGETIAVTLVIGNAPEIGEHDLPPGLHARGRDRERVRRGGLDRAHRAALIAAGLVLFVLTLCVNGVARAFVVRAERGRRAQPAAGWRRMSARRVRPISARRRASTSSRAAVALLAAGSRSCRSC